MTTLETLLVALRDGPADPELRKRARELARADERIPDELRDEIFADPAETSADAAGLLAVLGADNFGELLVAAVMEEIGAGPARVEPAEEEAPDDAWTAIGAALREGLVAEAQHFEIADAVMRRIPMADFPWGQVLAEAVSAEAGAVDVARAVVAELELPREVRVGVELAAAIQTEAGEIDVAGQVMAALELAALPVAEAVRAEAGEIDVADRVMLLVAPERPVVAANLRWVYASLLVAAITLMVLATGRLLAPELGPVASEHMQFARASEVLVEDLHYANDVQLMVLEGDDGAVILWFDEEA